MQNKNILLYRKSGMQRETKSINRQKTVNQKKRSSKGWGGMIVLKKNCLQFFYKYSTRRHPILNLCKFLLQLFLKIV